MIEKYITDYVPTCAQEVADKALILEYMHTFQNLLTRENRMGHFTSSGFITNQALDKVLCIHHNIYDSWGWTGGHMDGMKDFREVALKEAAEETGITKLTFLTEGTNRAGEIDALDVLDVPGHFKNGVYISAHVHLSVAYVLVANEFDPLFVKPDENSGVRWFPIDELLDIVAEPHMRIVYQKLINRINQKR